MALCRSCKARGFQHLSVHADRSLCLRDLWLHEMPVSAPSSSLAASPHLFSPRLSPSIQRHNKHIQLFRAH